MMEQCRAITFINFHIPRTEMADDQDIQYTTLGFFDGMLTQKIKIGNEENELENLWKYGLQRTAKSVGQYSYQNIFCFGQDEGNSCSDEEMWDDKTDREYPLTFVAFLQLQHYASKSTSIVKQCQELSNKIKEKLGNKGHYYTYSTVDKNDYVVCIKCRSYKQAVDAIKNLHTINANVVYSYSVFSVSNKVLNCFDEQQYQDIFEEDIDSICLKGVANSFPIPGDMTLDQKYRKYSEQLVDKIYGNKKGDYRIYDILGDNDFRLIARHVSLGRLLREFAEGGLLNGHKEQVRFYLFSSSMVLNTDTPNCPALPDQVIADTSAMMNKKFQAPLCMKLEGRMEKISERIKEQKKAEEWNGQEEIATFCSAIWQLLQSLKALEIPETKKYDFWSIYYPLAQLIIILEKKMKCEKKLAELSSHEEIFDFIYKISMTLHGTLRTDIQFFQIRDFNAIVHYAPSKLRAFFSLWALRLSDYYLEFGCANCEKSYSFILAPGMSSKVKIMQLFDDDAEQDRLMLIAVPERQLYMVKGLSIILGHEVSHYVGAEVRQRKLRHEIMIGIMARLLALEMNYYRWKVCNKKWKSDVEKIISGSRLHEKLEKLMLKANEEVCGEWRDISDKYHSHNSARIIKKIHAVLAKTYLSKTIGEECEKYNVCLKAMREDSPMREKIIEFQEIRQVAYGVELALSFLFQKFQGQLDSFLGLFYHVLKETCADINSILTLELTPEEYLQSFGNTKDYFDKRNAVEGQASLRTVRHALVMKSISEKVAGKNDCFVKQNFPDSWTNFDIRAYVEAQAVGSATEQSALWIYDYLAQTNCVLDQSIRNYKSAYDYQEEYFHASLLDCLKDKIIWEKMLLYGKSCVGCYLENVSGDRGRSSDLAGKKKVLVETYRGIADAPVGLQLQAIEDFLCNCEEEPPKSRI